MMARLIAVEWYKIVHRRLNWVTLAVLSALIVVMYALLWEATTVVDLSQSQILQDPEALRNLKSAVFLQDAVPFGVTMLQMFGQLAAVVVVGANVGSEYSWNTLRTTVAARPERGRLLAAKMVALLGAVMAAFLIGMGVALLTSTVITIAEGELALGFVTGDYLADSAASFVRLLVATLPYMALALLASVWAGSITMGLSLSVGVLFLEGIISALMTLGGGWVADIPDWMLDRNANALQQAAGGNFRDAFQAILEASQLARVLDYPSLWHAAGILLIWSAVFTATAWFRFERQDLNYQP